MHRKCERGGSQRRQQNMHKLHLYTCSISLCSSYFPPPSSLLPRRAVEGEDEVHTMSKNFLILPQMEEFKDAHQRFLCRLTLMKLEVGWVVGRGLKKRIARLFNLPIPSCKFQPRLPTGCQSWSRMACR